VDRQLASAWKLQRAALVLFEDLLTGFHFGPNSGRASALAAIFPAVVRPSRPHAPAFHVRAPIMEIGETCLCELIGAFAGPVGNLKVGIRPLRRKPRK